MRWIASLLLAGAIAPLPGLAAESADVQREYVHHEFRLAFDAGDYRQALPLAERVVALTQEQYGMDADELVTPLTNLATTLYRMEHLGEALQHYRRALVLLEQHAPPADARRVAALQGAAAVLRAMDRHQDAIPVLESQIELIRVREGLDSPAQFPAMRALIEAHENSMQMREVEALLLQVFQIAERAYGADDVRVIGPLCDLARWYQRIRRYSGARVLYLRAIQIADAAEPGNPDAIEPLLGLARTFAEQRLRAPGMSIAQDLAELPRSVVRARVPNFMAAPPDEGERALLDALQRLEKAEPPRLLERGEVMVALGNLYHLDGLWPRAMETWREAWQILRSAGDTSLLDRAALISQATIVGMRSPVGSVPGDVVVRVSITADGKVDDAIVLRPRPEAVGSAANALLASLRKSVWRPAFVDGHPVADPSVLQTHVLSLPKSVAQGPAAR